ncbi:glycerol-3-phosphate dehydrogenase C-terminal domain-containing protein, partial [Anoxybacillus sp. LAT27]
RLGVEKGVDRETAQEWLDTYGTNTLRIYDRLPEPPLTPEQLLRAQIQYAVEEEMTVHAVDFLRLRTGWTYFQLHKAEEQA